MANLIGALAAIIGMVLDLYLWIIIIRALISWVNPDPYNPIVVFLHKITEPVLVPVRKAIPMYNVGLDVSPLIVIFAIYFLKMFLVPTLNQFAFMLR